MKNNGTTDISNAESPSLLRLLAAILYDTLLVAGLLLLTSTLVTLPVGWLFGESAVTNMPQHPLYFLFQLALAAVPPAFFLYFWQKGGQTLGMKSWKLMVIRTDGAPLTLTNAVIRFLGALVSWSALGLGYLWMLADPDSRTWHDRLSGTQLVMLEKLKNQEDSKGT